MNRFSRVIAALSTAGVLITAGWGNTAVSRAGAWGQSPAALQWQAGVRVPDRIKLAGAKNGTLYLPIVSAGRGAALQARVEGLPAGVRCRFFQIVAAPAASSVDFPPDALLPLQEAPPVPAGAPLYLWVSFKVAPDCAPGDYPLNLVFTDRQVSASLQVDLKVYRFTLPDDLPITIFGGFWLQPEFQDKYLDVSPHEKAAIIKKYYASLREHKFNALGGSYPLPMNQLGEEHPIESYAGYHDLLTYALNDLKFKYCQIPKVRGWQSVGSPESDFIQQSRRFYPIYSDYLRRHGWENRAINYLLDEPRPAQYDRATRAYALAKSSAPGIKTLCAGRKPPPGSTQLIDMWAYMASSYYDDKEQQVQHQGQEAWLYVNRLQGIDHPLEHQRLVGWLLYRYQFSGCLIWGVNYWPHDPWTNPPGPGDYYRRGTFYYPHPKTGLPVATTRLEALRRGFQDYQYLLLLDQACRQGQVSPEKREHISAQVRRITGNLPTSSFPVSMGELEAIRLNIGEILDDVAVTQNSAGINAVR